MFSSYIKLKYFTEFVGNAVLSVPAMRSIAVIAVAACAARNAGDGIPYGRCSVGNLHHGEADDLFAGFEALLEDLGDGVLAEILAFARPPLPKGEARNFS